MLKFAVPLLRCRYSTVADIPYVMVQEKAQSHFVSCWGDQLHRDAIGNNDDIAHLIFESDVEGRCGQVGFAIIRGMQNPDALELMRLVISYPGKGYGREVLQSLKRYAFEECDYGRVWLDAEEANTRALGLYISEGFRYEEAMNEANKAASIASGGTIPYLPILSVYKSMTGL
jgi:diamine N-acetyltransferase